MFRVVVSAEGPDGMAGFRTRPQPFRQASERASGFMAKCRREGATVVQIARYAWRVSTPKATALLVIEGVSPATSVAVA